MSRRAMHQRGRVVRRGGRAFSPASIANLRAWYRSDTGLIGSAPVTAWSDKTGNNWNLGTSAGPTRLAGDLNGFDTVSFDGVSQFLTVPSFSNGSNISEWTKVLVAMFFDQATYGELMSLGDATFEEIRNNLGTEMLSAISNTASATDAVARANQWLIVTATRSATGALQLFINGTSVATGSGGLTVAPAGSLNLGRRGNGTLFGALKTPEAMLVQRVVTTTERQSIEAYLKTRYNLP